MTINELWQQFSETKRVKTVCVLGRPYIYISHETFCELQSHFKPQFALFHSAKNYRSLHWWRHIHAIVYEDHVCVHIDHANPNVSIWFNIPHGFLDVAPYLAWCVVKVRRPFGKV